MEIIFDSSQVDKKFKEIKTELPDKIKVAINESAIMLSEEIKESIEGNRAEPRSVDTGAFLNSIQSQEEMEGASVSSDVPQSVFMEYGTGKIQERRHFRNSTDRLTSTIVEKVKEAIETTIE